MTLATHMKRPLLLQLSHGVYTTRSFLLEGPLVKSKEASII